MRQQCDPPSHPGRAVADPAIEQRRQAQRFMQCRGIEDHGFLPFGCRRCQPMATMNVSLPDPMRDFVQSYIDSGQYASVSDYVHDLIRRDQTEMEDEQRWPDR
jgi:putative addiction module CopG family antidote